MELTGNAYWAFRNWLFDTHGIKPKFIGDLGDRLFESYLIDWLDSEELYIMIEPHIGGGADVYYAKVIYRMQDNFIDTWSDVLNEQGEPEYFSTRHQATQEAIKKAVYLYNERS